MKLVVHLSPIINNYLTFVNEKWRKCEKIIIFQEKLFTILMLVKYLKKTLDDG